MTIFNIDLQLFQIRHCDYFPLGHRESTWTQQNNFVGLIFNLLQGVRATGLYYITYYNEHIKDYRDKHCEVFNKMQISIFGFHIKYISDHITRIPWHVTNH